MAEPLLRMRGIAKRFGATVALNGVSLDVFAGRVTALLGENGAGKSTLMKILSGAHAADAGAMTYAGQPYAPRGPHAGRLAGVGMIYQELNLAPDLSVEDNIMLGQERSRFGMLRRRAQRRVVRDVLGLLGHGNLASSTPLRNLSVAMAQVVEIARALVVEARVLVFDEPTSSLTRADVDRLFAVIRTLKARGLGILYISHFLEEVRGVCDSYCVLRDGRAVGQGDLCDVTHEQLITLMAGRSVETLFPTVPHAPGETLLAIDQLSGERVPRDVALDVRRGEILGISGLVGAGRTEFLRCLFALDPVTSGRVRIGSLSPAASPRARIDAGLGFVSEDRKREGLAQDWTIRDNLTLSRLAPYTRCGCLALGRECAAVADWIDRLAIKAQSQDQAVSELSGGNQQKVSLARVLHQDADVLLLDEPTRGIDVSTKSEIYRLMGTLAAQGKAVVFVSSYFSELLAVCDRIAVMARGRLREIRPANAWTEESLLSAAISGTAGGFGEQTLSGAEA
jgi:ribose transport system ATP-binding protein